MGYKSGFCYASSPLLEEVALRLGESWWAKHWLVPVDHYEEKSIGRMRLQSILNHLAFGYCRVQCAMDVLEV